MLACSRRAGIWCCALSGKDHPELISDRESITIVLIGIMAPPPAGAQP
jgi:hypothetical protein